MRSPTADVNRVRQPMPEAIVLALIHAHSHPQGAKDKTDELIRFRLVFPASGITSTESTYDFYANDRRGIYLILDGIRIW